MKILGSSNNSNDTNANSNPLGNIDMGTIMKMKSVMDGMNAKDDPRGNLLSSLKPYLNDSRKGKVDQYVQLFNMTKIMNVFGGVGGGKSK